MLLLLLLVLVGHLLVGVAGVASEVVGYSLRRARTTRSRTAVDATRSASHSGNGLGWEAAVALVAVGPIVDVSYGVPRLLVLVVVLISGWPG